MCNILEQRITCKTVTEDKTSSSPITDRSWFFFLWFLVFRGRFLFYLYGLGQIGFFFMRSFLDFRRRFVYLNSGSYKRRS